jgi:Arylsulfotransferase (ASST)
MVFITAPLWSQILPVEGSRLHYRIIGFLPPDAEQTIKYEIEVAMGNIHSEDSFKKNIISRFSGASKHITGEVPSFGSAYTWRAVYYKKKSTKTYSPLYHFTTSVIPEADTNFCRLRIIKPALAYKDAYVFIDGHGVLYDMSGSPVWFVPDIDGSPYQNSQLRDLKLTPQGTITFLLNDHAYEINYAGEILWRGPDNGLVSGNGTEQYHHELTRLSNGHYMVLGNEQVLWSQNHLFYSKDSMPLSVVPDPQLLPSANQKTFFGTIIEYDEKGSVVWSWKSSGYFIGSDVENYTPPNMMKVVDVHENAFYFDEKDSVIYVSFRNINRIVKLKYPGGNVIGAYGEKYQKGVPAKGNGFFCEQHGCKRSSDGYLLLFNNNVCNSEDKTLPEVLMMEEPVTYGDSLKIVWKFGCTDDEVHADPMVNKIKERRMKSDNNRGVRPNVAQMKIKPNSGGNVIELPDHSIFVAMNTQYGKVFIVSRDKQLLWSAVPEKFNPRDNAWYVSPVQYRASMITDQKLLENLVWQSK